MRKSTSSRVYPFAFVLMLILLLSSMIGTAVWAGKPEKPGKPGKPPPDLVVADFKIWIGGESGTEDISLNPPGSNLLVVGEVGGPWLPPRPKQKNREAWSVGLGSGPEGEEDDCGMYTIGNEGLTDLLTSNGVNSDREARVFHIYHITTVSHPQMGEYGDYWWISIRWEADPLVIPGPPLVEIPRRLHLSVNTNKDTEWEGVYDEITDTWTATFDAEWFELTEYYYLDGEQVTNTLLTGQLSFTVKVQRILPS